MSKGLRITLMTIAKHIVEAHGGRIWAESAGAGQGGTFYFTLPIARAET
jgi:two-component system phosphate regulon sensor histidine kinase PhoR